MTTNEAIEAIETIDSYVDSCGKSIAWMAKYHQLNSYYAHRKHIQAKMIVRLSERREKLLQFINQ